MTKTLVTLILAFIAIFAAGTAVGYRRGTCAAPAFNGPPELSQELNLTDAQREKLKDIWQPILSANHSRNDQRRGFESQRDKAVQAILTPDQMPQYNAIMEAYHAQTSQLDAQRHKAFQAAQDATRAILDPTQLAKYEELLKAHHPPGSSPATQPDASTTQPDANATPTTAP